ncbi:histone-like nucleoid-structuring protein Lsr2 [Streptomyces nogalater]
MDRSGLSERERNRAVRAWARKNGYAVPTKGRIPMHVRHAYELTHKEASEEKRLRPECRPRRAGRGVRPASPAAGHPTIPLRD